MSARYLTATELASRLGVRPETVLAWRRRSWIPAIQCGKRPVLFDEHAVIQAMRKRAAEAIRR